jgi:hypothetical protein
MGLSTLLEAALRCNDDVRTLEKPSIGEAMTRSIRLTTAILATFIGLTAFAGGVVLICDALAPGTVVGIVPDGSFLHGSPFGSYLVPGLLLAVVIGGTHLLAVMLLGRASRTGPMMAAVAAFGLLIWIFVQMMFIPFSPLQAIYFTAGLAELILVLLGLGLLEHGRVSRS